MKPSATAAFTLLLSMAAAGGGIPPLPGESSPPEPPEPAPNFNLTLLTYAPQDATAVSCRRCKAGFAVECDRRTLGRRRFHKCRVDDYAVLLAGGA